MMSLFLRHIQRVTVSSLLRPRVPAIRQRYISISRPLCTSPPRFQSALPKTCPSCSAPMSSPVPACTNCWNIFSIPPGTTHHDLFGLPYEPNPFSVDLAALKQRFRQAQAVCHPDAWASRGPNKQDVAQALSSRVNNAYQTLLRPLARAEYILSRNKLPVSEEDKVNDIEFMMEIMEARERIEESEDVSEVAVLIEENDNKIGDTVEYLEELIGQKNWVSAKAAAIRLRYLEGIARAGKQWMDKH